VISRKPNIQRKQHPEHWPMGNESPAIGCWLEFGFTGRLLVDRKSTG
jgi:hypothetical protein